jgi:hypothetical protein
MPLPKRRLPADSVGGEVPSTVSVVPEIDPVNAAPANAVKIDGLVNTGVLTEKVLADTDPVMVVPGDTPAPVIN